MDKATDYEAPAIRDYGDLVELTRASGQVGSEDGVGKAVVGQVGPVGVSVGIFP